MGTSKGRLIKTTYKEFSNKFISLKNVNIFLASNRMRIFLIIDVEHVDC